ncbi:MAG: hypothetical protein LUQ65_15245 [Candidatus Helarchaeota archaeon]|nr:hypothetical protein [Candidatus Helarchaeota archaeon]
MKARIWNEKDRIAKIKLELELLEKSGLDPFEIVVSTYDTMKKILFDSIKEENPDISFEELLNKARTIVSLGRRDW